jgi:hypothetical protein
MNNPSFRPRAGDTLLAVDDVPLTSADRLGEKMRGLEDTTVKLTVKDKYGIAHWDVTRGVNHILDPEKAWRKMQDMIKFRVDGGALEPHPTLEAGAQGWGWARASVGAPAPPPGLPPSLPPCLSFPCIPVLHSVCSCAFLPSLLGPPAAPPNYLKNAQQGNRSWPTFKKKTVDIQEEDS